MGGNIFISYRRANDSGFAGRLYDRLCTTFPKENIFLDVDNIEPGLNFVTVLNEHIDKCDVVLVLIGHDWANVRDQDGRRIDNPADFVRIEIESALKLGKFVVPVPVHGAAMPRAADLPGALKPLASIQGLPLSHERFHADVLRLIGVLEKALAARRAHTSAPAGKPAAIAPAPVAERDRAATMPAGATPAQHGPSGKERPSAAGERESAAARKPRPKSGRPGRFGLVASLASAMLVLLAGAYWLLPPLMERTPEPRAQTVQPAGSAGGPEEVADAQVAAAAAGSAERKDAAITATREPSSAPPKSAMEAILSEQTTKPSAASKTVLSQWKSAGEPGSRDEGTATWSVLETPSRDGRDAEATVRADVTVAGQISATVLFQRNTDASLPASHMIELQIYDAHGKPLDTSHIQGIDMKAREEQVGSTLKGLGVEVTNGFFLFGLSQTAAEMDSNLKLLREQEWFDFFLTLADGRRVTLAIEKGDAGRKAFAKAFGAWDKLAAQ